MVQYGAKKLILLLNKGEPFILDVFNGYPCNDSPCYCVGVCLCEGVSVAVWVCVSLCVCVCM